MNDLGNDPTVVTKQKILILYLANSALDSPVKAWTVYDGTSRIRRTAFSSPQAMAKKMSSELQVRLCMSV